MMGHTHALTGVCAWLAAAPVVDATSGLSHGQIALGTAIAAGASMAPDFDHWNSTIARTYGPLTNIPARLVAWLSGGHRGGTHSLLGLLGFTGLATWCAGVGGWPEGLLLWVLFGVAARAIGVAIPGHRSITALLHTVFMAFVTALVVSYDADTSIVLPWAMGIGVAAHIAGDMLTDRGCPLLWPFTRRRFGVGLIDTNGWVEPVITTAAAVTALVLASLLTQVGHLLLA